MKKKEFLKIKSDIYFIWILLFLILSILLADKVILASVFFIIMAFISGIVSLLLEFKVRRLEKK